MNKWKAIEKFCFILMESHLNPWFESGIITLQAKPVLLATKMFKWVQGRLQALIILKIIWRSRWTSFWIINLHNSSQCVTKHFSTIFIRGDLKAENKNWIFFLNVIYWKLLQFNQVPIP